jgi:hypothetical protein
MLPSERHKTSPLAALIIAVAIMIGISFAIAKAGEGIISNKQYPEQPVKPTISDSIKPVPEQPYESKKDSLIKQLYPICVVEVNKSTYKGYKWEVIAENGLMYYTNKKPKIGDPAFYIGSDSETLYWTK